MRKRSALPFGLALLAAPTVSLAQALRSGVNRVGGGGQLPFTGISYTDIIDTVTTGFLPLINFAAILVIVISGITLILSQEDDRIAKTKKILIASVLGVILVNIAVFLRDGIIQAFFADTAAPGSVSILKEEVLGVIEFIETPAAIVAIVMIIISGIRAILTFGTDQGGTNLRRTIFATGAGIILLAAKEAITLGLVGQTDAGTIGGEPSPIVNTITDIVKAFVLLMGLAGVAVLVLAGIFMIVNVGNQEQYDRAKKLAVRVIIGLIIIFVTSGLADLIVDGVLFGIFP